MVMAIETKCKSLDQIGTNIYHRGEQLVYIDGDSEYYVGNLIGYTFAHGAEGGGYVIDGPDGLAEWTKKGGTRLYCLKDRYEELVAARTQEEVHSDHA